MFDQYLIRIYHGLFLDFLQLGLFIGKIADIENICTKNTCISNTCIQYIHVGSLYDQIACSTKDTIICNIYNIDTYIKITLIVMFVVLNT